MGCAARWRGDLYTHDALAADEVSVADALFWMGSSVISATIVAWFEQNLSNHAAVPTLKSAVLMREATGPRRYAPKIRRACLDARLSAALMESRVLEALCECLCGII